MALKLELVASLFLVFCSIVLSQTSIEQAFIDNEIVPDVIDKAPTEEITIRYASGAVVNAGNELTPEQTATAPNVVTWAADPLALYTLIMVDPDAPSRPEPTSAEILHWLAGNIPGSNLQRGDELLGYAGPNPPAGSGLHRYITMAYVQPNGAIQFDEADYNGPNGRRYFNTRNFTAKYGLGDQPLAGNFFQAQRL